MPFRYGIGTHKNGRCFDHSATLIWMGISIPLLYSISMDVAIYWPYRFQSSNLTLYNKGNKHISQNVKLLLKIIPNPSVKGYHIHHHSVLSHIIIIANWHVLAKVRMYTCKPKFFLLTGSLDLKWSQNVDGWMCVWLHQYLEKTMCTQCVGEDVLFILVFVTMQIHRRYTNRDNNTHWGSLLQKSSE